MKPTIIKTSTRYVSEIEQFSEGLPHGILNKTKADVGGSYLAINCPTNYIVVCPFKDLCDSLEADKNNKYNVFKIYGGVEKEDFDLYSKKNKIKKIVVTFDSFDKLTTWINPKDYKLLIDEYHLIISELDYRQDAIESLLNSIKLFDYYTFLSATPIEEEFEISSLKTLPHYIIEWENKFKVKPIIYNSLNTNKAASLLIDEFYNGLELPDIDNKMTRVKELFIFTNSVSDIATILKSSDLDTEDVKIICGDRIRNKKILDKYSINKVTDPNKKVNFFTKKGFQGVNLFSNNALVVIVSNGKKEQTLVNVSTEFVQIASRLRYNNQYQNCFRHILFHIVSRNNEIESDDEFEQIMKKLQSNADEWIDLWDKANPKQKILIEEKTNLEAEIVSVVNNTMIKNELKENALRYKRKIKKEYDEGIEVAYQSKGYEVISCALDVAKVILNKSIKVGFRELLEDYMTTKLQSETDQYEKEYKYFKDIKTYFNISELNSLRWNEKNILNRLDSKIKLNNMFKNLDIQDGFYSNQDLKKLLNSLFKENKINYLIPKITMFKDSGYYDVKKVNRQLSTKVKVNGLEIKKKYKFIL